MPWWWWEDRDDSGNKLSVPTRSQAQHVTSHRWPHFHIRAWGGEWSCFPGFYREGNQGGGGYVPKETWISRAGISAVLYHIMFSPPQKITAQTQKAQTSVSSTRSCERLVATGTLAVQQQKTKLKKKRKQNNTNKPWRETIAILAAGTIQIPKGIIRKKKWQKRLIRKKPLLPPPRYADPSH